ncbi:hypothetical protein D9757_007208 [Collybiopsis confluens]|uniref:Postreplication repair E3 ubiquitin-protein ligase RAD18 n=1 Tax=Collybiopsis confluens TaxID=2823264 RepID=A0A8H5M3Z3_9AGAR|nr:hypothetical protein D9757_007208 [Collybiopsis confluens]
MESKNSIQKLMSDIQDPSDFESPGLRSLDTALRCSICAELFDGPVSLKCGHCFCSLCIREALQQKQECPACREDDVSEGHLRRNTVMEEAVAAWKQSRPYILLLLARDKQREGNSSRPSKKRRLNEYSNDVDTRLSSESEIAEVLNDRGAHSEELVDCPACHKPVKHQKINQHLDNDCQDEPEPGRSTKYQWDHILGSKSQLGKSANKKGKERSVLPTSSYVAGAAWFNRASSEEKDSPLPKKSYDTLKDKTIKEFLREHDLSTAGDRKTLVARHQRWVIIYNANLDKSLKGRKSLNGLRRELNEWETQQKSKTKHDVTDSAAYQMKNKSEFDKLVEAARPKKFVSSSASSTTKPPTNNLVTTPRRQRSKTEREAPPENAIVVYSDEEK